MEFTFEKLPYAVKQLNEKLDRLIELQGKESQERDHFMTVNQLSEYLPEKPSKFTVYGWVSRRTIPFHKEGKKLLFKKSEIDQWIENGRSMRDI